MGTFITVTLYTVVLVCALVVNLAAKPKTTSRLTMCAMAITGVGGLLCYCYGHAYTSGNVVLAVIRAGLDSMCMFIGRNNFSAVSGSPFFSTALGLCVFWFVHLAAFYATASATVAALGSGLLRKLRLWLARRGELVLIYGSSRDALNFGSQLMGRKGLSVVFVDEGKSDGESAAVAMGSLLRNDPSAASPDRRLIRSLGIRPGGRKVRLYAIKRQQGKNLQYAQRFLDALEDVGINPDQTSLTMLGNESSLEHDMLNSAARYGYGDVTVVNEAQLAARLMIKHAPPWDVVSFDTDGRALDGLHCLIVGFGRIGQEVLRSLVTNGQFEGAQFSAAVFDPNCRRSMGNFAAACAPMLRRYDVSFFEADGRSREMYDYLTQHGGSINYLAICTGNDELNDELAEELTEYFHRMEQNVATCVCSHSGLQIFRRGKKPAHHSLYSAGILYDLAQDEMAKELNQTYSAANGLDSEENWRRCDYFSRMSSRASADFAPAFVRMSGVDEKTVLGSDWDPPPALLENMGRTEHLRWCAFHYSMGFEPLSFDEVRQRAQLRREEIAQKGGSSIRITKDTKARRHACLVDWEALDELSALQEEKTGETVDYKSMDINNVLALPRLMRACSENR